MGLLSSIFGGGNNKQEVEQRVRLNKFQRAFMEAVTPKLLGAVERGLPELPQIFEGFSPAERAGIDFMRQAALGNMGVGQRVSEALGDLVRPGVNPFLEASIQAAIDPIYRRLTTDVLPSVRSSAIAAGGYGGSRQGIAEGLAAEAAQREAGRIAAQLAAQGYESGLEAAVRALGMAPAVLQASLLPAQQLVSAGELARSEGERLRAEAAQREFSNAMRDVGLAQEISRVVFGLPGGSMVTTSPAYVGGGGGGFSLSSGLSGALTGAALAKELGFISPGVGAGIGFLLGLL